MWIEVLEILKRALGFSKHPASTEAKEWQQVYLKHIEFLNEQIKFLTIELSQEKDKAKADYDKQIAFIEEEKIKHPENGVDLDKWSEREKFFYEKTIELNQKVIDLTEMGIFREITISMLESKFKKTL